MKATTILRKIDDLEKELLKNYAYNDIKLAIKQERKKKPFKRDGLVDIIAVGVGEYE